MGIQFPPIAFLYPLYFYIVFMMMIFIISCSISLYSGKKQYFAVKKQRPQRQKINAGVFRLNEEKGSYRLAHNFSESCR